MYIKIQTCYKEQKFILEEAKTPAIFKKERFLVSAHDYVNEICPEEVEENREVKDLTYKLFDFFDSLNEFPNIFYGNKEARDWEYDLKIAHIRVNGINYFTTGKIYILNDNGQTIQSI